MHAYLIVGTSKKKKKEAVLNLSTGKLLEFPLQKIADVKDLSHFLKVKSNQKITIVLEEIEKASIEALNSFLKLLEEPGKNIQFILTTSQINSIIPTIVSRCFVVNTSLEKVSKKTKEKIYKFLKANKKKKFEIIEKIKDRKKAISFLEKLISVLHEDLLINPKTNSKTIELSYTCLERIKANANVNLQTTNLLINLPEFD